MLKNKFLFIIFLFSSHSMVHGQQGNNHKQDTSQLLSPVIIRAYLSEQRMPQVPASVGIINQNQLSLHSDNSLLNAMNTVPGIRMEERSPGSYRLSIRGSSLRSPYGVRNIKIYLDNIPLTDAGGNTYLNALDARSLYSIEILKGPDGSLFGANSGGIVLINPTPPTYQENNVKLNINAGSYGLIHQNASIHQNFGKNALSINQGYQSYKGYRNNSEMHRQYLQVGNKYRYGNSNTLKFIGFYSDLDYQTPGGLTLEQMNANPRASRPETQTLPSAEEQQIGIKSKIAFGGLINEIKLNDRIKNTTSIFGSHVDFKNPFITNFEKRQEKTYGSRSYFELINPPNYDNTWKANLGAEWQQTNAKIKNYDNIHGSVGAPQAFDEVNANQYFVFARFAMTVFSKLSIETALSLNNFQYAFKNTYPLSEKQLTTKHFEPQLMPRLALSYTIFPTIIWRASISRGYSTPTIAEVRPSSHIINTELKPEIGWNYETGFRVVDKNQQVTLDASIFYYNLNQTIVSRRLENDIDNFINAGGTKQLGFELNFSSHLLKKRAAGFIREIQFNEAITISKFNFKDYTVNQENYSGNKLTGVPEHTFVSSLNIALPKSVYLFIQHNYTGKLPLNDANTANASPYNLVQAKAGWNIDIKKAQLSIYAGVDNLLNQNYSLGNDINTFGNRYYNPAPLRNFYGGVNIIF